MAEILRRSHCANCGNLVEVRSDGTPVFHRRELTYPEALDSKFEICPGWTPSPVTAPRPPSDETPATGWPDEVIAAVNWRINHYGPLDAEPFQWSRYESPAHAALSVVAERFLVVDPAEAREKIARALWSEQGYGTPFDRLDPPRRNGFLMLADAVLAALTAPEPPRVEDIVDGWVKPAGGEA